MPPSLSLASADSLIRRIRTDIIIGWRAALELDVYRRFASDPFFSDSALFPVSVVHSPPSPDCLDSDSPPLRLLPAATPEEIAYEFAHPECFDSSIDRETGNSSIPTSDDQRGGIGTEKLVGNS